MIQIRTSPLRRAMPAAVALAAAGLLVSGCGQGGETTTTTAATLASSSEASETTTTSATGEAITAAEGIPEEPAITVSATPTQTGDRYPMELSIYPLERQGDLSLLRMTLQVGGNGSGFLLDQLGALRGDYDLSGITLIADGKRYLVATDSADECACSEFSSLTRGTYELSAVFAAPPEEIDEVTLQFPELFTPVSHLPVS